MKIAFAIPTYNRVDKLTVLVNSILAQQHNAEDFEVYCVISNSCSTDGTSDYLNSLTSDKLRFVIHNQVEYESNGEVRYVEYTQNFRRCFSALPEDVDWVWLIGDDDVLYNDTTLQNVLTLFENYGSDKLSFIHACQVRRSQNSGQIFRASLFELCNSMGFHEVLGWMSSLIVRKDRLLQAFNSDLFKNSKSAYSHSAALLQVCHIDDAIFIDLPLADPQDDQQTPESIERWQRDNIGERYFYVVDDLLSLYERKVLTQKCSAIFFRYLTYSFWDRYICYLIGDALNTNEISARAAEHWNRVLDIGNMFEDPAQQKLYTHYIRSVFSEVESYINSLNEVNQKKTKLIELHSSQSSFIYPFTNLDQEA